MDQPSLIERLARHLAAGRPDDWPAHLEQAASMLAIMKEPDAVMREAGDGHIWRAMIDAALRERWTPAPPGEQAAGVPDGSDGGGSDEEGEIRLPPDAVGRDNADWVHIEDRKETRK
ncbi:MAG: hypothetical protein AB7E60_07670 [Sphingobium sp.]